VSEFICSFLRYGSKVRRPGNSDWNLGLKRKCIFPFSRKCENHAKMGRFSRNFTKIRFEKNVRFRENFRENLVYFLRKVSRKRKTQIFAKILSIFRKNFCENAIRRFSRKSCLFFAKTKNADFCKKFSWKWVLLSQKLLWIQKFLAN
jgi:hypothetical protein